MIWVWIDVLVEELIEIKRKIANQRSLLSIEMKKNLNNDIIDNL